MGGVVTWMKYAAAPHGDKTRKAMLKELNSGRKRDPILNALLFRNREALRTWYMRKLRVADQQVDDVQIIQQDQKGTITAQYYARTGHYDPALKTWTFLTTKVLTMNKPVHTLKTDLKNALNISH